LHVWANITVEHAIQWVQHDRVSFEVSRKKRRANSVFILRLNILSLYVVQKYREMWGVCFGDAVIKELVHENLINAVFA